MNKVRMNVCIANSWEEVHFNINKCPTYDLEYQRPQEGRDLLKTNVSVSLVILNKLESSLRDYSMSATSLYLLATYLLVAFNWWYVTVPYMKFHDEVSVFQINHSITDLRSFKCLRISFAAVGTRRRIW